MFSQTLIADLVDYQAAGCQGGELDVITWSKERGEKKKGQLLSGT